jgi:hypothetical protein
MTWDRTDPMGSSDDALSRPASDAPAEEATRLLQEGLDAIEPSAAAREALLKRILARTQPPSAPAMTPAEQAIVPPPQRHD